MVIRPNLTILGCHSSIPTKQFYPTAQILKIYSYLFLIDCGEGTQVQLRRAEINFNKITHVFISHLHGDHYFGLISLLLSFQLLGRENILTIYSPIGLKDIININLKWSKNELVYPINYIELSSNKSEKIFEDHKIEIYTIPLKHRIYTNGFLFKEKKKYDINNINKKGLNIKIFNYQNINNRKSFDISKKNINYNNKFIIKLVDGISYAFCSDTAYYPNIIEQIQGVSLLYHESTFLIGEENRAKITGHSTAEQAAKIAKKAGVGKLLLGHYSSRVLNIKFFEKEAKKIFPNTEITQPLKVYWI